MAADLFASEEKSDALSKLQDHLLDESWVKRVNELLLSSVENSVVEREEKTHHLFENFQKYESLFEERLLDFCTDHPEFGNTPEKLVTLLTEICQSSSSSSSSSSSAHLQRLLEWTEFDHFVERVESIKKEHDLGVEAADFLGL
jgi:hypothetical protein